MFKMDILTSMYLLNSQDLTVSYGRMDGRIDGLTNGLIVVKFRFLKIN